MVPILQAGDPILRKHAESVALENIATEATQQVIRNMQIALHSQDDGVAIAAPQIGVSLQIFVVSGKVFDPDFLSEKTPTQKAVYPDLICINPKIIRHSKTKKKMPEGCLSVRWLYGDTRRYKNVTIEAYDANGQKFQRGGGNILAQIFQHEIEHLEGILFIDHAEHIEEMLPPEKDD